MLPSYEPRKAQLDLLELIIQAFNEDSLCMAEAGTGVGKSFAYILPSVHFALLNHEKQEKGPKQPVVISTATITLQQQLYEKDIPLVASAVNGAGNAKIKAVIMKGRGNYVCLRRLDETFREPPLIDFNFDEFKRIAKWADTSKTGVKSELPFVPSDTVWLNVCSESDLCMGSRCPRRENCFVLALRKEASGAHIVVVNHHLLFADLAARYQGAGYENAVVLPPFSRLIIDEAHTIEKAATSFFSAEFARTGIYRQLGRLYNQRRAKGLLVSLCSFLPPDADPIDDMADIIGKIRSSADALDECALQFCGAQGMFRFTPDMEESVFKASLFPCFRKLKKNINALNVFVNKLLAKLDEEMLNEPVIWEIKAILRRLEGIGEICAAFTEYKKHADEVLWIEKHRLSGDSSNERNAAVFTKSPLDLAPKLKDSVFMPNKTVICVSATLAINGDFSYWAQRSGIADAQNRALLSGCFPSPFPYSSAVLLASPADAPLPDEYSYQDFIDKAAGSLAAAAGGSALVLFTSYQSLKSHHLAAKKTLEPLGIRCLKQGDDDRTRLLRDFLSDESSCLFATDSFWEGVDAPGDTLRMVIICRLPFRTPGDPVFEARCEAVQKRGGSSFMELSLPHAVMKFKQGFGRLMRRSADHGVVVILDSRLHKKSYGQLFLQSLPETKVSFSSLDKIIIDVENFLF